MKVIRTTFEAVLGTTDAGRFIVDRKYDTALNDQENCDKAMDRMCQTIQEKHVMPCSRVYCDKDGKTIEAVPVILNISQYSYIQIIEVGTYDDDQAQ